MYMREIIFKPLFIFETYTNALSKVVMEKNNTSVLSTDSHSFMFHN